MPGSEKAPHPKCYFRVGRSKFLSIYANGSNHNRNNKFKNSKGKEVYQQEVYHIRMSVKADTNKVVYVEYSVYEQNEAIPDGKSRTIMKKVFK